MGGKFYIISACSHEPLPLTVLPWNPLIPVVRQLHSLLLRRPAQQARPWPRASWATAQAPQTEEAPSSYCCYYCIIAYRILLTILVTVASLERYFSKLKLLKTYLCSTITQERLNGLVTIAVENDILEEINYEDIIEDFISKNTRSMLLFSRTWG